MECVAPDRSCLREWRLFSAIPRSIPIPPKSYSLIVGGRHRWERGYTHPGSRVKNHTFFPTILYSLRSMVYFCTN
ncbi:hypothetical protein CP911_02310 [Klebsiella quasipneumoniae]|uniref:Uncharacterized protein n=1 Tax=Klebsiella quasipneumoniae TaxID=1463165 RepID=A0A2A5MRG6_9ENTR|nr:hypothetical protein CP911_02310 [Klebsiella quasipneumoniae]